MEEELRAELKQFYLRAKELSPFACYRMAMDSKDEEERRFFAFLGNMNLQRRQAEVIEQHLF